MDTLLLLLAIIGVLAVLRHALDALLRLLHGGVEGIVAGGRASTRAQRGDVTGLQEAEVDRIEAARRRRVAVMLLVLWCALLLVPPLTPWPRGLYALYSLVWLLPRGRPGR